MTTKFKIFYSLPIVLFYACNILAEATINTDGIEPQKFYDIEVIIFKNISVPKGQELNLPTPSPSRTELTLDMANSDSIQKNRELGFTGLQQDELRLFNVVQQIIRSSRYELLSHTGWRQPGLDKNDGIPVWIKGGKTFGYGYSSIDQRDSIPVVQSTDIPSSLPVTESIKPASEELYELEGQIIITLSRYLHTQANLVLRKPAKLQNMIQRSEDNLDDNKIETEYGQKLLNFALNEKRRMRSTKLHYLDHPEFGMLVLITPYEAPESSLVDETTVEIPVESPIAIEN